MKRRPRQRGSASLRACAVGLGLLHVTGCAHDASRVVSTDLPGHAIITIPIDSGYATTLFSNPYALQAGIDGRTLAVTTFVNGTPKVDQITVDFAGDMGVRGNVSARGSIATVSHRSAKKDIRPFVGDGLGVLDRTAIVTYRYRDQSPSEDRHIGFIAEDAPSVLSGSHHDRYDLGNAAAVDFAATKALRARIARLEVAVRILRSRLR